MYVVTELDISINTYSSEHNSNEFKQFINIIAKHKKKKISGPSYNTEL